MSLADDPVVRRNVDLVETRYGCLVDRCFVFPDKGLIVTLVGGGVIDVLPDGQMEEVDEIGLPVRVCAGRLLARARFRLRRAVRHG